jgi:small subunit ribosomal protein S17
MKKQEIKNIGIETVQPNKKCEDKNCPYHGTVKIRGRVFEGEIKSKDAHKTSRISWERLVYIPKYERYMKKRSKLKVHNPICINAQIGDLVRVVETRPISKTKNFVIVEKLKK